MGRHGFFPSFNRRSYFLSSPPFFRICSVLIIAAICCALILPCTAAQDGPQENGSLVNAPAGDNRSSVTRPDETNATEMEKKVGNLINKGIDCAYANNYACVIASFDAAHATVPEDTVVLYDYAVALAILKKYDESVGKIDAALALDPEEPRLWYARGAILKNAGNYAESGRSYERAEELDPDFEVSFFDHYPMNFILITFLKNTSLVVLLIGFAVLGIYIWFNERKRS